MSLRRALAALLCWLLAGQPVWAACSAKETANIDILHINDTSIVLSGYSTANTNQIVLAVPFNWKSSGYASVTSVTDTAGLTWARRGVAHQMDSSTCFGVGSPCFVDVEVWWATAASPLVGDAITAHWNDGVLAGAMFVTAFDGVQSPIWDTNGGLPTFASNPSGADSVPSVSGISTTLPQTLLLAFCEWTTVPGMFCVPPAGWAGMGSGTNYQPFSARSITASVGGIPVATPQSGITVTELGLAVGSWMMFVDALVCAAGPAPPTPNPPRRPFAHGWPW